MNNSFYIADIAAKLEDEENRFKRPEVRRRLVSDPCLPLRLPTTSESRMRHRPTMALEQTSQRVDGKVFSSGRRRARGLEQYYVAFAVRLLRRTTTTPMVQMRKTKRANARRQGVQVLRAR